MGKARKMTEKDPGRAWKMDRHKNLKNQGIEQKSKITQRTFLITLTQVFLRTPNI